MFGWVLEEVLFLALAQSHNRAFEDNVADLFFFPIVFRVVHWVDGSKIL